MNLFCQALFHGLNTNKTVRYSGVKWATDKSEYENLCIEYVFSTSTLEMRCLLDGESSLGRGSDEQEMALIHRIAINK